MGYADDKRSSKLKDLIGDLRTDIDDMIWEVVDDNISRDALQENLMFMRDTYDQILNKLEKKYGITILGGTDND